MMNFFIKIQTTIFLFICLTIPQLFANTTKKYELYDRAATHYLLNALMFEEYLDMERAIASYETAYTTSNSTFLLVSKAIDEYYLGNDKAALKIFENIKELPDQLLKYKYYQYLLSNTERKEYVGKELLNELIELYSQDPSKSQMKEGLFLLEKLLKNYMDFTDPNDFELFINDAINRDISKIHKDFFSAVLFKFYSKVKKNDDKVTKYVKDLIMNYEDADYQNLVFVYDELIDSNRLELAEEVFTILKKVRYLDPEYYIFNYLLEKAKSNGQKARRIISYALDSFPSVYFKLLSLREYLDQKEFNNANIVFNKLLSEHPKDSQIYQSYIMALIKNEYIDKAMEVYEISIKEFPEYFELKNNYAYLLTQHNKDIDKALDLVKQAVNAKPDNISFLDTLAWIYYLKEDYIEAETLMEQIFLNKNILLDENSKELFEHYKQIKLKLNKPEDIDKIEINELAVALHECVTSAMSLLK